MYIVLLTITIQKTTSVRLVVLREHANSASEEDTSDALSADESEEIDLLMDLIEKESKNRDQSPTTTVRVIKQIAEHSVPLAEQPHQTAQPSFRKERVESHPNSFREYHVHYHNHQHRGPVKPPIPFDDNVHPHVWNTHFPLRDFEPFRHMPRPPFIPFAEHSKIKEFKHVDDFFKTHPRSPFSSAENIDPKTVFFKTHLRSPFSSAENIDPKTRLEALQDYEAFIKPRIPTYRSKPMTPYERIKKFQEYYDSEEEKTTFTNKNRFAGFKDFSELENAEKPKNEQRGSAPNLEKKTVKIKDFAIVIKSRPRKNHNKETDVKENSDDEDESAGLQIPPFVNKLSVPYDKLFGVPRIVDAAGGTPKYIDALNQLRYQQQQDIMPIPMPFPLNAMENEHRKLVHMRAPFLRPPFPLPPPPHHPHARHPLRNNGWLRRHTHAT